MNFPMNKKILTFAITICNEVEELRLLLSQLVMHYDKNTCDILILLDYEHATDKSQMEISRMLNVDFHSAFYARSLRITAAKFLGDFSEFKNKIEPACNSEYIFQIDADEVPSIYLIQNLVKILLANPDADILCVPRINTVHNIEKKHVIEWGWNISSIPQFERRPISEASPQAIEFLNELNYIQNDFYIVPIINFPDYQTRIFKTGNDIKWHNKVHEILGKSGNYNIQILPSDDMDYCLLHAKHIEKQILQNNLYKKL